MHTCEEMCQTQNACFFSVISSFIGTSFKDCKVPGSGSQPFITMKLLHPQQFLQNLLILSLVNLNTSNTNTHLHQSVVVSCVGSAVSYISSQAFVIDCLLPGYVSSHWKHQTQTHTWPHVDSIAVKHFFKQCLLCWFCCLQFCVGYLSSQVCLFTGYQACSALFVQKLHIKLLT